MSWAWFTNPHAWALLLPLLAVLVNGVLVRKRWPELLDFMRMVAAMFAMYPAVALIIDACAKGFSPANNAQILGGLFMLWIPAEAVLKILRQLYAPVIPTAPALVVATPPDVAAKGEPS